MHKQARALKHCSKIRHSVFPHSTYFILISHRRNQFEYQNMKSNARSHTSLNPLTVAASMPLPLLKNGENITVLNHSPLKQGYNPSVPSPPKRWYSQLPTTLRKYGLCSLSHEHGLLPTLPSTSKNKTHPHRRGFSLVCLSTSPKLDLSHPNGDKRARKEANTCSLNNFFLFPLKINS